ncbi:MAG: 4-(cytidine 5'-diphospho)-2-C-methyl-D-erythritol kinase [Planctomycetota bacterium]|jgi:4-diphosphocytidyl-2-C-methyl-D-erythritol kinase
MDQPVTEIERVPRAGVPSNSDVSIEAPAKVNLYLEILGRRADGYHEIETVMQTVSLADTLNLRARTDGGFELVLRGRTAGVPADGSNLVIRAAEALAERLGDRARNAAALGADIELVKKMPPGSGLGGGSSDAAATLVALRQLWGLEATDEDLMEVAAGLGSDVPFFVRCGAARCTGRGEVVEPLRADGVMHAVLVLGEPLSTARVYEVFSTLPLTPTHPSGMFNCCSASRVRLDRVGGEPLWNALEPAAFRILPRLRDVKERLLSAGAEQACLSGSGSCVYGVVESERRAERVAEEIETAGHECVVVRSVGLRC